jgi:hypothetical protein
MSRHKNGSPFVDAGIPRAAEMRRLLSVDRGLVPQSLQDGEMAMIVASRQSLTWSHGFAKQAPMRVLAASFNALMTPHTSSLNPVAPLALHSAYFFAHVSAGATLRPAAAAATQASSLEAQAELVRHEKYAAGFANVVPMHSNSRVQRDRSNETTGAPSAAHVRARASRASQ